MADAPTGPPIRCGKCGKQYAWRASLVGKTVRCTCGATFKVAMPQPVQPGPPPLAVAPLSDDDDAGMYDLAPAPAASPKLNLAPLPASKRPGSTTPQARVNYREPESVQKDPVSSLQNTLGGSVTTELILPTVLIAVGIALQIYIQFHFHHESWHDLPQLWILVGLGLTVRLVLSTIAMLLLVKLFNMAFGSPGPAFLKLAAIAIMPSAVASLLGHFVGGDSFTAVGAAIALYSPLVMCAFIWLFSFDFSDALYSTAVLTLINLWFAQLLTVLIMSLAFG